MVACFASAGIYLSSELSIAHSFAARGMAWEKSMLVGAVLCMLCAGNCANRNVVINVLCLQ